jgi:antitoxin (DNA-binding transcriptional repressor) of toxin-antitoxin stability system
MIQVKISELKNNLSYYLRLVRGGEEVEILDRDNPVGRILHISQVAANETETPWIREVQKLGIVEPPREKGFPPGFFSRDKIIPGCDEGKSGVLDALLDERSHDR